MATWRFGGWASAGKTRRFARLAGLALATALGSGPDPAFAQPVADADDLFDLSLEELVAVEVVSVTGVAQGWFQTPAAVSVISGEDLRRSGFTNIADALRLVPGAYVGRVDSSQWSTGVRGFANVFYPYLQVLVDGRSVYNELFSGVYWDVQTPLLEDIDTIEVIRGPGATLWGANAVNGVINVTTREAKQTHGAYLSGGGGRELRAFGEGRYGMELAEGVHVRAWGSYFDRDDTVRECGPQHSCPGMLRDGSERPDDWSVFRGGVRLDAQIDADTALLFQGEGYATPRLGQAFALPQLDGSTSVVSGNAEAVGGHALVRLEHNRGSLAGGDERGVSVQAYYDVEHRESAIDFRQERDTVDLDFRHHFRPAKRHTLMWGLGYRYRNTQTQSSPNLSLDPTNRESHLATGFVQDTITLFADRLFLMLGSKFEYNSYTGFEPQPSGRLWWTPSANHTLWAAISRPVRTPSLVEQYLDARLPLDVNGTTLPVTLTGVDSLESEKLLAYELGYRVRLSEALTVDIAGFYYDYWNLIVLADPDPPVPPLESRFRNQSEADVVGVEVEAVWQPLERWRLQGSYSFLHVDSRDSGTSQSQDRDPEHQFQIRSYLDITPEIELDTALYFVDSIPSFNIPSYFRLDVGLTWRPIERLELSVWGQNLIEEYHAESEAISTNEALAEVQRGFYGRVRLRF